MRIAEYIDTCDQREGLMGWINDQQQEVLDMLAEEEGRVEALKEKAKKVEPAGRCAYAWNRQCGGNILLC